MTTLIINITHDLGKIPQMLDPLVQSQLPFAISVALNRTVNDSIGNVRMAMVKAFGTPRPYTLNSMYMKRATKNHQLAGLYFKDSKGNQTPAISYLTRQIVGDSRPHKPNENIMKDLKGKPIGFGVTGGAFKSSGLDKYGNIPYGVYTRALRALQKKDDDKAEAQKFNLTKFVKEKFFGYKPRKARKKLNEYFIIPAGANSHLSAGLWQRKGRTLSQILSLQEKRPNYKAILDFDGETYNKAEAIFGRHFAVTLTEVIQKKLTESFYPNENQN